MKRKKNILFIYSCYIFYYSFSNVKLDLFNIIKPFTEFFENAFINFNLEIITTSYNG